MTIFDNTEFVELQKQIDKLNTIKQSMIKDLDQTDTTSMTKKELQEFAMNLPPIRDDLWADMMQYGFQTGSSIFGSIDNPADIDWVCQLPAMAFTYSHCAVPCGKITTDYVDQDKDNTFVPLYANRNNDLYNIICISSQKKFNAWKQATAIMKDLFNNWRPLDIEFKTKWKRVRLFRALTDILEPLDPISSYAALSLTDALKYEQCMTCGREANNFTCKSAKDFYKATAICERCQVSNV